MKSLKFTKWTVINFCLLATVLLLAAQTVSAQFTIGGVTISKPKRPNKPNTTQPEKTTPNGTDAGKSNNTGTTASGENRSGDSQPTANQTSPQSAPESQQMDFRLSFFLDEIAKTQKLIDSYDPNTRSIFVRAGRETEWLMRAISKLEREKFVSQWLKTPYEQKRFADALDSRTLPPPRNFRSTFRKQICTPFIIPSKRE